VAGPFGTLRSARVCNSCFARAIHIVAAITITGAPAPDPRAEQRRDARVIFGAAVAKLRKIAKLYEGNNRDESCLEHDDGRAAGLSQAADLLEAGDFDAMIEKYPTPRKTP
jgi:hypothetical protein